MTAARIAAVDRVRSALSVARDLAGVPGHYSDALHDLVAARDACTQWLGDEENALRREADAYLDANAWQRAIKVLT